MLLSKRGFFNPLIVIILGLSTLVIVAIIFYGTPYIKNKNKQLQESHNQEVASKQWQFGEKTANKETYSDSDFKIEIPENWFVYPTDKTWIIFQNVSSAAPRTPASGEFRLSIQKNNGDTSLEDYVESKKKDTIYNNSWTAQKTEVNSEKAVRATTPTGNVMYYVKHPSKPIFFQIFFVGDFKNHENVREELLSSFKFI